MVEGTRFARRSCDHPGNCAPWSLRSLRELGHQECTMFLLCPALLVLPLTGRSGGQFGWWILSITGYPVEPCSAGGTSENQPPALNGLHLLVLMVPEEELDLQV